MNTRSSSVLPVATAVLGLAALCLSVPAVARQAQLPGASSRPASTMAALAARPAAYRAELLEVAFAAASAFPADPHAKNRSRAQEQVVSATLELGQPEEALARLEQIDDWRRGGCYADLAYYLAKHGDPAGAERWLESAQRDFERSGAGVDQEWRKDRIRAKIARTYLDLGQIERAAPFRSGLAESEMGRIAEAEAETVALDGLDGRMAALEAAIGKGGFEPVRNAVAACSRLHDRFYGDWSRRARLEDDVRRGRKSMPLPAFLEALSGLVHNAVAHGDHAHALELVAESEELVASVRWLPNDEVAQRARLAELTGKAGAKDRARLQAAAAIALYDGAESRIVDVERAAALRPVAEAYLSIGERDLALAVYRRAIEAGAHNPNARPRADDLVATCCSMAVHGMEPDLASWERIRRIRAGLIPPW